MTIEAVFFDLGFVLVTWAPERAFEPLMPADEIEPFMEKIGLRDWNMRVDNGERYADIEEELCRRFPEDREAILGYRPNIARSYPGMVAGTAAIVAQLSNAGITLTALSNWSDETFFPVLLPRMGILKRFDHLVISGAEGIAKPDPEIYRRALARAQVSAEVSAFTDDLPVNVAAANDLGMHGIVFTGADDLRAQLVELGLPLPPAEQTDPIYHWALRSEWEKATTTGEYPWSARGLTHDAEGFVHFSFADQAEATRNRFYADLPTADLVRLRLDPQSDLPVVVENGFPHLFAPLPIDKVVAE